jgi:hypothetical protein
MNQHKGASSHMWTGSLPGTPRILPGRHLVLCRDVQVFYCGTHKLSGSLLQVELFFVHMPVLPATFLPLFECSTVGSVLQFYVWPPGVTRVRGRGERNRKMESSPPIVFYSPQGQSSQGQRTCQDGLAKPTGDLPTLSLVGSGEFHLIFLFKCKQCSAI